MDRHHQENCVIIGAGIAGLCAACYLAERGNPPLVIDAGVFPHHRICGEFLSPESLPLLLRWDLVPPAFVDTCIFKKGDSQLTLPLPEQGGSWSRYDFDAALLKQAQTRGATILTETRVKEWKWRKENWELTLSNGDSVTATFLIVGTGRLASKTFCPRYLGMKAHFKGISLNKQLEMYCFKGGYFGVSPIGPDKINVAGIAPLNSDPLTLLPSLMPLKEMLDQGENVFSSWMCTAIPQFGIRNPPHYPHVLWVGDAAGSIPPICGGGLTIALLSGEMAADYVLKKKTGDFRQAWYKRFRTSFRYAKMLHTCAITPALSTLFYQACKWFPHLPEHFFTKTRQHFSS